MLFKYYLHILKFVVQIYTVVMNSWFQLLVMNCWNTLYSNVLVVVGSYCLSLSTYHYRCSLTNSPIVFRTVSIPKSLLDGDPDNERPPCTFAMRETFNNCLADSTAIPIKSKIEIDERNAPSNTSSGRC